MIVLTRRGWGGRCPKGGGEKQTFGSSTIQGLAVKLDVPDFRSAVLGFPRLARIDEPLPGGRMCADQCHQITLAETHVFEAINHFWDGVVDVWKETSRGFAPGLPTTNPRLDWGSAGAGDDCEDTGHL